MKKEATATWNTKDGRKVVVTVTVTRELYHASLSADGVVVTEEALSFRDVTEYTATVAGQVVGTGAPVKSQTPGVWKIGQLGIVPENLAKIEAAVVEAKTAATTHEIAEHIAKAEATRKATEAAAAKYERDNAAVRRAMNI